MVRNVIEGNFDEACSGLKQLYDLGYSPTDIVTTLFRIIKSYDMAEYLKLEFMKVNEYWERIPSCLILVMLNLNLRKCSSTCRKLDLLI